MVDVGAVGVVVDRQLGPDRRGTFDEQLGAEEAGLDDGGVDAERLDVEPQRLHPAFDPELAGCVGGDELLTDQPGGRRDRHDMAGRCRRMTGSTARVTFIGPNRLVSIWARIWAGLISSK